MPLRPELRHLYRTKEWSQLRAEVFKRARGHCEQCGKPAGVCFTYTWQSWRIVPGAPLARREKVYHMVWISERASHWRDQDGRRRPQGAEWPRPGLPRRILVQLGAAHVDPDGEFLDRNNVRVFCDWCHLHHDQAQHHFTRAGRRDRSRPILQEASNAQRPGTLGGIRQNFSRV